MLIALSSKLEAPSICTAQSGRAFGGKRRAWEVGNMPCHAQLTKHRRFVYISRRKRGIASVCGSHMNQNRTVIRMNRYRSLCESALISLIKVEDTHSAMESGIWIAVPLCLHADRGCGKWVHFFAQVSDFLPD